MADVPTGGTSRQPTQPAYSRYTPAQFLFALIIVGATAALAVRADKRAGWLFVSIIIIVMLVSHVSVESYRKNAADFFNAVLSPHGKG